MTHPLVKLYDLLQEQKKTVKTFERYTTLFHTTVSLMCEKFAEDGLCTERIPIDRGLWIRYQVDELQDTIDESQVKIVELMRDIHWRSFKIKQKLHELSYRDIH